MRWGVLLVLAALPGVPAHASAHHGEAWARERFAAAERMREALNGRPPAERARRDYQRVINSYRNVYFGAPTSTKADPSVVAVAETLVEMGRRFDDDKILNEAIAQYKFLRKEYPGSKYRGDALFTIGEIYKDDLNDPEQARAVFQEFLHRYPHNRLVEDAHEAIAELDRDVAAEQKAEVQNHAGGEAAEASKLAEDSAGKEAASRDDATASEPSESRSGRLPRVTGIRHWSTPDYTRVAIDVESEVKFSSQRIGRPDRIFFDLRDTKLASTLVGKSFDVDDGFLKKIRVAQFQPGRTRVVLEVEDLSDYDAFLLPNPYRLIIDIHGKDVHAKNGRGKDIHRGDASGKAIDDGKDLQGQDSGAPARGKSPREILRATADVETPAAAEAANSGVTNSGGTNNGGKADSAAADTNVDMRAAATNPGESDDNDAAPKAPSKVKRRERTPPVYTVIGKDGVKKVIVEADDDDEDSAPDASPAETARAGGATVHTDSALTERATAKPAGEESAEKSATVKPAGAKAEKSLIARNEISTDAEDNADDEKDATDPHTSGNASRSSSPGSSSRGTSSRGTSSSRLAESRSSRSAAELDIHEARPTASGDRSLIRALGLKIGKIVIDPGHGGHDTGTIGPNGLEEKDLVLDVGRRLGRLLESRLGAQVVYTRKDDTFIPLETRTAIANQQRADLFISIHANSSDDSAARGVETYYLNFTSSPDALEVAARENAVSEKSIYELQDLVKKIALKEKIEESREFAGDVQDSLHNGLAAKSPAIRDRGVKKAPFIVLIGANMPSILAEISFVSNPTDERRLETGEYRQRIAESLYRGIAKYANGLSGVKLASKIDRTAGQ